VSRALRFIAGGALDEGSVEGLADRLGIGERHLRRLFLKHLGASPIAVAQTKRLHFAKQLIDETDLPMAQIAFEAGFLSLRRFNAAMKRAFDRSPTHLRKAGRSRAKGSGGELVLRLPFRPPLDWDRIERFLCVRAIPGVEAVRPRSYRRVVRLDDAVGVLEVTPTDGQPFLSLRIPSQLSKGLLMIIERIRRLFDLGAVPSEISAHLSGDPCLAPRIEVCRGLRVPGAWDGFELAVRAVLGQQVTVRGATTLIGRLVQAFGERVIEDPDADITHTFPAPDVLATANVERIGLPRARAACVRALAAAVSRGDLSLNESVGLERSIAQLTEIPGIGPWTAHYIAMRALGEPDAFPEGDLGLRRALSNGRLISTSALAERAEQWRPWRAYAAMTLWST
jgi:AraC family transcriptional regulator of adaptative response / DNA-3-methyladenine glycosylase II